MKKLLVFMLAAVTMFAFINCKTDDNNGPDGKLPAAEVVTITFNFNYDGAPEAVMIANHPKGTALGAAFPQNPQRPAWSFTGWFDTSEATGGNVFTQESSFDATITLYARWIVGVNAVAPVISSQNQPQNAHYIEDGGVLTPAAGGSPGMAAISVRGNVSDGGTVSYEWFKAADAAANTEGTLVTASDGTLSFDAENLRSLFTPSVTAKGTYYYYAIATNTNDNATGNTTASTRSNTAVIRITGQISTLPSITIGGKVIDPGTTTPAIGRYGSAHTGSLSLSSMGYIVLKDTEYASVNVSFGSLPNPDDSIKVQKTRIPDSGSSVPVATNWETAASTLIGAAFTGKDVIQIQHTRAAPPGASGTDAAEVVYYSIYIRRAVDIPYLADAADALNFTDTSGNTATITIEAGWDNAAILVLDRPFMQDSPRLARSEYDPENPPILKMLWSDDGLYFYIEVEDATVVLDGASDHEVDNLELFISENFNWTAGNWNQQGGQYRVARGGAVSGDSPGRVSKMVNSTATGYTLMIRVAFADAATGVNDKMIGFDPQLAYCFEPGTRDACILWSNFLAGSYQQRQHAGLLFLTGKP